MKRTILKIAVCALFAAPVLSHGQDTNTAAIPPVAPMQAEPPPVAAAPPAETPVTNAPAKPKKLRTTLVVSGKVASVDTNAMTLTVGKRTYDMTSETRITKAGDPAILGDIAVGDKIAVAYKKAGDKFNAVTINDGKKTEKADGEKKKAGD